MNFDEGVRKAAKAFYDGKGFDAYEKTTGKPVKHTLDMLNKIQDTIKPKQDLPKATKKTPKGFVNNG